MFHRVMKGLTKIRRIVRKTGQFIAGRVRVTARRLWRSHSHRMKSDAAYAAAAAVVLSSCLGAVPVKEALAAVLAVVLGIAMSAPRASYARPTYDEGGRWNTDPDWDSGTDFA